MKPAMAVAVLAVAGLIGAGCASNLTGDGDDPPRPAPSSETVAGGPAVPTVLVIDGSGSMLEDDAPGPRIDAAKAAAHTLIDGLDTGTELAVVTYGTETTTDEADHGASCRDVTTVLPAGPLDAGAARDAVDSISPSGFTPIAASLTHAADQLPETGAQAIVLISDGEDTCDTPPCEVAADLHDQRPELTISTIGFRTEGEGEADLRCIAETTGGLFVTADNADQLAERLLATRDLDTARTALTSTGIADIAIGDSADEIRQRHPDLPEVAGSGTVTIVWIDCDLVFEDGLLTEIAPHDGGRTIDGVGPGEKFSAATRLYGEPVQTEALGGGAVAQTVVADGTARTGYRIYAESDAPDARITQVVLCKCLPGTGSGSDRRDGPADDTEDVTDDLVIARDTLYFALTDDKSAPFSGIACEISGDPDTDSYFGRVFCLVEKERYRGPETPRGDDCPQGIGWFSGWVGVADGDPYIGACTGGSPFAAAQMSVGGKQIAEQNFLDPGEAVTHAGITCVASADEVTCTVLDSGVGFVASYAGNEIFG